MQAKTMTQSIQDRFKDLNWSLTEFDRIIDVILSNFTTIKEELHEKNPEKEEIVAEYYDILNFKIETVYSLLIRLEELIFSTTFVYYKKYHGPIRGELSQVEFENIKREISYIFDSFLTQYQSLLDLAVKFIIKFSFAGEGLSKIDSFGRLLTIYDNHGRSKNKKKREILEKSGVFKNLIKNRAALEDIKMYRDYIIHHGYVRHQLEARSTEGHVLFSYLIPLLIKTGKISYDIDPSVILRIDHFCRQKLHLLLSSIAELTDFIYEDSFKHQYISKLKTFPPELTKEVLLRISKKDRWADKVFFEEEKLKAFLASEGINFNELVEDIIHIEKEEDESDESVGLRLEKVYYKPIGSIRIFRTRFIHKKRQENAHDRFKPVYSVMITGLSPHDFISQKPELEEILDTLRKSGLAYVIKIKGEIRYASAKYDLTSLIVSLDELSRFKWSFIQIPEMKYFRSRTKEETEISRKILGEKVDEYLRKEDKEKERIQKEYREWKKQPKHYFPYPLNIVDKEGRIITRITHKEYIEEKNVDFQNWKQNKRVFHIKRDDEHMESGITSFFSDKDMDQELLEKLIRACKKQWKGQPKHFLELEKERIKKHKKEYNASLEKFRKISKPIIEKYKYLMPIFSLLNQDAFVQ